MSNIPKARVIICDAFERRFKSCASDIDLDLAEEILKALELMTREKALRRAPRQSIPMTSEIACELRAEIKKHPLIPLADLAAKFGVNAGRASEVLRGRYIREERPK